MNCRNEFISSTKSSGKQFWVAFSSRSIESYNFLKEKKNESSSCSSVRFQIGTSENCVRLFELKKRTSKKISVCSNSKLNTRTHCSILLSLWHTERIRSCAQSGEWLHFNIFFPLFPFNCPIYLFSKLLRTIFTRLNHVPNILCFTELKVSVASLW